MKTTQIGPRPAAYLISFAPECFEVVGERVEYVVVLSAPSYPKRFDTREEAEAFARKTGRTVSEEKTPVTRRVKWF